MEHVHEVCGHSQDRAPAVRAAPATPGRAHGPADAPLAILTSLQRQAGNRAVSSVIARGVSDTTKSVQRAPEPPAPGSRAALVAPPSALADVTARLRAVYATVPVTTLYDLRQFKTIAVGYAIEEDPPNEHSLVWTANGNWNDPFIEAAMAAQGINRWDPGRSRAPRGAAGAPGDAEQRMLSEENYVIKAMVVSRAPCGDCVAAIADYGIDNGPVQVDVVLPPDERQLEARAQALASIASVAQAVRSQVEQASGEHQAQLDLIYKPSVTGFVGFWTNRLFNKEIPPTAIWNNAWGALAAVGSSAASGDVRRALGSLIRARREFLLAQRQYLAWKEGLEPAGQKAQIAIGVIALAAIAAVVAPAVIEAAAVASADVGSAAAAEQMAVRIAATLAEADATMLAAEAIMTEAELAAEAELETELMLGL